MTEVSAIFGYIDLELWKAIHVGSRWIICRCIRISAAVKALFIDYIAIAGCFKKPPGRLKGSHIFCLTKRGCAGSRQEKMHGDVGIVRNIYPITKSEWFAMCVCLWYCILQAYSPGNASCSGPRTGTSCVGNCFVCIAARITCCTRQHYVYLVAWVLPECKPIDPPLSQPLPSLTTFQLQ